MITPSKAAMVEREQPLPKEIQCSTDVLVVDGIAQDLLLIIEGDLNLEEAEALYLFLGEIVAAMKQTEPEGD